MQFKNIVAAVVLAAAAVPSFAVTAYSLSFNAAGNASFSNNVAGLFDDAYTFTIASSSGTAVSATNVGLNFGTIANFGGTLAGTTLTLQSQTTNGVTVQVLAGATPTLAPGLYTLHITGNAGAGASYGGSLLAQPVPEPQSYALMLAGLGAIGFLAARRKSI